MNMSTLALLCVRVLGLHLCLIGLETTIHWIGWFREMPFVLLMGIAYLVLGGVFLVLPAKVVQFLGRGTEPAPSVPSRPPYRVAHAVFALVLTSRAVAEIAPELAALAQGLHHPLMQSKGLTLAPVLYLVGAIALFFGASGLARMRESAASFAIAPDTSAGDGRRDELNLLAFGCCLYGMYSVVNHLSSLHYLPGMVERLWERRSSGSLGLAPMEEFELQALGHLLFGLVLLCVSARLAKFWGWLHIDLSVQAESDGGRS